MIISIYFNYDEMWPYGTPFSGAILGGKSIHTIYFAIVILKGLDLLFHVLDFVNLFIFAGSPLKLKGFLNIKIRIYGYQVNSTRKF